ncbi:MAG: zinc-dependent metalloprotease [Myxococcota bacterium]|nr:zinc-dependent metalloprotease [Myxococcota bacterium]
MHKMNQLFGISVMCFAISCAEPAPDIDRTQGNLIAKQDLAGEWYMMQTITGVPPTSWFTFIGETGRTERIRWEIQRDLLVAYRSYPLVRGADAPSTDVPFDGTDNPVAAYRIINHVDLIRDYNTATGEQSNVIVENVSDRLWHERDYVRVDWSQSLVSNFDFIAPTASVTNAAYFVPEELGQRSPEHAEDAFYRERTEDGRTHYFDVNGKMFVEPDIWGCVYTWWGFAAEDCTAAEIKMRTSFSRVEQANDYEPFHYSDQLLSRFGYFRTEYFTYDEQRGLTESGRRYLINRHNIWTKTRDENGVIPIPQRSLRTIPYYLSKNFPQDELLLEAAKASVDQWNRALLDGLAAFEFTSEKAVFVLCHNPVQDADPRACGERGFSPRIGDLRYSTLHWVDTETLAGLLGYGPSTTDPVTGEIIAGKAYVYGAAINTWATYAVDVIRYFNGDLDLSTLVYGRHFTREVSARAANINGVNGHSERLDQRPLRRPVGRPDRLARPNVRKTDLRAYDRSAVEQKIKRAHAMGGRAHVGNPEVQKALARRTHLGTNRQTQDPDSLPDATLSLNPIAFKKREHIRREARAQSVDFHDMVAPDIEGIVRRYAGRTDYDEIWREIRAEVFASTTEHELGHTLGLRHNFQGSYDSLNYHEAYWDARQENLFPAESLGDLYRMSELTEEQKNRAMRQHQYSSIMDYGYNWHNDLEGLGKYDRAALVFGYTSGGYATDGALCDQYPSTQSQSGCIAQLPGLVEVFKKRRVELGDAGDLLTKRESAFAYDDSGLPSINILERYHYTTLALAFPELSDMRDSGREWMNYAQYLNGLSEENRVVRVPYMFCSDEWESGLVSCHAFDQGADPFEIVRAKIDQYRAYYPFTNFRMDNPFFEVWYPLDSYFWRIFLPLSDVFQSWYVAPYGDDPLFDRSYDLAINAGFNLLSEVLTTPAYGTWCQNEDGRMIHLSDEPVLQGDNVPTAGCLQGGQQLYVPPGEGRRRFSIYDTTVGYYFPYRPQEAGHYWATLAALWAMTDPEAFILGVDGDAGTYAISFYDWFTDEFTQLMNNLLVEDFNAFAPSAQIIPGEVDDNNVSVARVSYQSPAPIYDAERGARFNPETGRRLHTDIGGNSSMCESCTESSQCLGYTGRFGGVFCEAIEDGDEAYHCLKDCTNSPDGCPAGTSCNGSACVPDSGQCGPSIAPCSPQWPYGQCASGRCVDGACQDVPVNVLMQAEPTFMLTSDIIWYGFLFTTSSFSTRFNDQLNVFRPGTNGQVEAVDDQSSRITFTDPTSGVSYAAVQPNCPQVDAFVIAGSSGLCSPCETNRECAGHTGELGGVYCQPIGNNEDEYFCLKDCSEAPDSCGPGSVCDDIGNCIPEAGQCYEPRQCSGRHPLGSCDAGNTCIDGRCVSAQCLYGSSDDTGAVRLVKRGLELSAQYNEALSNWYRFDEDPEQEAVYGRLYYQAKYALENHVDLLETLLATYSIFGRVY